MKNSKSSTIQLPEDQFQILLEILRKRLPDWAVYVFGSRAHGDTKATSDLDLLIRGQGPIDSAVLAELRMDLEEAEIEPRVVLADWWRIDEEFRNAIWPRAVQIYEP